MPSSSKADPNNAASPSDGGSPTTIANTTTTTDTSWKLENSPSLWWLQLEIWKNPGNVFLITSVPFCLGAYFGYKKPSEKLERLAGGSSTSAKSIQLDKEFGDLSERRRLGLQTAGRALRLGTLGAVGGFGVLSALGFYGSGYETMDEALEQTRRWATSHRESFERWLSMEDRPSKTHPEVVATKHMTEDEELDYLYERYVREPEVPVEEAVASSDTNHRSPDNSLDS